MCGRCPKDVMEFLAAIQKNEIVTVARKWMQLEIFVLSEVSQTQKDKFRVFSYMWDLDL